MSTRGCAALARAGLAGRPRAAIGTARATRGLRRLAGAIGCLVLLVPPATGQPRPDRSFAGTWPCEAGCAGRQVTLTLFGDHAFRLRLRAVDARGGVVAQAHDIGRWGSEGTRRVLRGGAEAPMVFELGDDGSLQLLDAMGLPVPQAPLQPLPAVDPVPGPMPLRGLYVQRADAPTLAECRTGRRWPVRLEGAHGTLERAYLDWRTAGGNGQVLVTIVGRFESIAPQPGLAPGEAIRVERFERLWPGRTCADEAPPPPALVNVRWRIVEIDGEPVVVPAGRREPFVLFAAEGSRVRGFGGCNSFAGRFALGADGLEIRELAAAAPACAAAAQEAALLDALRATVGRVLGGGTLQLRDGEGRVRVRAEAPFPR